MTGNDPTSGAARRARREQRRRKRRHGKRLILAGYVALAVAVVVGAAGFLGSDGDGSEVTTGDGADDARRSRRTTTTQDDVVIDLIPPGASSTTPGGAGGGGGGGGGGGSGTVGSDTIVTGDSFGIRTVFGIVQVKAAPRASRPRPNGAPTISAPTEVRRDAAGDVVISGITIEDPDYPGTADIGVLLITDGTITVTLNREVQLLAPNSGAFVALAGPPEALNRALADLRVHADDATDLFISVTDWAYGDLPRAEAASTQVLLR